MKRNAIFFPAQILSTTFIALAMCAGFTAQATCTPPPAGLVAWWPGEGNATDYIGNNSGTLSPSGVTFVSGKVGQAFHLDGTNGYVQIPDSTVLKPTNVTVEAWVWLDPAATNASGGEYIIFKRNTWTYLFEGYVLAKGTLPNGDGTYSDRFQFLIARNGNQVTANSTTAVQRGVWYHVAGTYDGNTAKLFVNGGQESSVVAGFALDYGTLPIYIGASGEPAPYQGRLAGIIDEPSIYNRALTTNEIGAIYNAGTAGKCQSSISSCTPPSAGLAAWWPGEGNAIDYIGNNSATLSPSGVTFVSGKVGQGFRFNGTNGYLQIPDSTLLKPANITIEAWVWLDPALPSGHGAEQIVFKKNTWSAWFEGYSLAKDSIGNGSGTVTDRFEFIVSRFGNQVIITSQTIAQRGVWYHVAATYDGNQSILYVNGVAEASATPGFPLDYDTTPVYIGTSGTWAPYLSMFAGIIDEPSIYNRALSTNEIAAIYNAGSAGKCLPQSSVPVIYSILPASAAPGTLITISGNNFSPVISANIVYFGAVTATVLSASPTSLTVLVPSGATYAPLTVTVNGLVAYSPMSFEPTFAGGGAMIDSSTFAPGVNLNVASAITTVIADLNGDGKPDLAMANVYANSISICQNIGSNGVLNAASFASPVVFPVGSGSDNPISLTVADVDGDGKLDLLVADRNGNRLAIFQNISAGGMLGTNSFSPPVYFSTSADPRQIAVCDLDGDGHPDIICANNTASTLSILRNLGIGGPISTNSFAPPIDLPLAGNSPGVVAGDLDGDGKPDLAVADSTGFISLYRNHCTPGNIATNSFDARVDLPAPNGSLNVVIGDLDGDGKPELIATAYLPQTMSVYRNLSVPGSLATNSFGVRVDYPLAGRGHTIALSDLNGDGKPDITEVTELSSVLSLFQNISNGSFTNASLAARVDFGAGWNAWGVAVGDLDGDGRPDAVFGNVYDNTLTLYKNISSIGNPPVITSQPASQNVAAGSLVTFNAIVQGAGPVAYQWSYNGTNLNGATNSTLTLTNVQPAQAGNYLLQATNNYGFAISSNAMLTVFVPTNPPVILSQTPSQIVLLGGTVNFGISAGGTDPLSYFWMRNGALIPGATNFNYSLTNAQLADSGSKFNCLVTNSYGFAASTNVTLKVIDGISNDLCSGAVLVTNFNYTNFQSTTKATSFGDPVPDCVPAFGNGVWYQFTPPGNGRLTVDTFGSDFDTGLAVYAGSCDSLTELACNDDTGGVNSLVTLPVTAGTTLSILAGGYSAHVGNLAFHLNFLMVPTFVVQPTNESIVVSSNAIFAPTVAGTQPISYQWYFNGVPLVDGGRINGATNLMLTVANVQTNDAGSYQVVASNLVGVTTSSVAMLTPVILPPFFVLQPANQTVVYGSNATFTAAVDGTPPYYFQWSFNGNPLADDTHVQGANTTSLTISNVTGVDTGSYQLIVTNVSGFTNSVAAALTVLIPPVFTVQPVGRSVAPGLPTTFTAATTATPAATYQWQLNGTNLPAATSPNYTVTAVGINNLGFYHLVASNAAAVTVSSDAQLTFGPVAAWGRNVNNESLPPPGLSNVIAVAGTFTASFAVRTDGTVAAWGGSGGSTNIPASASNVVSIVTSGSPGNYALRSDGKVVGWNGIFVPAFSNIVAIAAGNGYGYALRAEGALTNWGIIPTPGFSAGLNQITAIACGNNNAVALRTDGKIVVSGSSAVTNVPASVTNVIAVAAGNTYAMALRADGKVIAWGSGTITNLPASLTNIIAISAGNYPGENFGLAIRANGQAVAFGDNGSGETTPPAALTNLLSVAIAAAPFHGLALVNDGSPQILQPPVGLTASLGRDVSLRGVAVGAAPLSYQWLLNGTNIPNATNSILPLLNLQFANAGGYQLFVSNYLGTAISLPAPLNVISNATLTFLTQNTATPTNLYQGGKFTVGGITVLGNGPLRYQWFFSRTNNNYAAIPGATNDTLVKDPALAVDTGNYYVAVSNAGGGITSAPVSVRVLFAKTWGYLAVDPPSGLNVTNAVAVAVGNAGTSGASGGHYLALRSDGKISPWGTSFNGETNVSALSNSIVTAVAAGWNDSLALKSDGTVYAWGNSGFGETNVPSNLSGVMAIACGDIHDLALKSDGTVVGWGQNNYQQITNAAATNVVSIAASAENSIALRADGSVVTWGQYGLQFQIPLGTTNIIAVACGTDHFLALRANGTVVAWGSNPYGQTVVPPALSNVVAISASSYRSLALRNDGTVVTWGSIYPYSLNNAAAPLDLTNVIAISSSGEHDVALFGNRAPAFTVQPWNRTIPKTTTSVWFAGKCAGVQPIRYQWLLNGTNLPAATNDTLTVAGQQPPVGGPPAPLQSGVYQLVASNSYGVAISKPAKLTLVIPLGDALDATNLNWSATGNSPWFGETNITHDGVDAARSGGIGASQETILQTTLATNYSGRATFWWKVSSEQYFDTLEFRVNGVVQATISGQVDWQFASIPVPAGTNLLQWRYSKDYSFDDGLDAAFVDQFVFVPDAPVINVQPPALKTANLGESVSLSVSASGAPQMRYQWTQNGSVVGNSPTLAMNNVSRAQNGTYFVTVTNMGGATVSSNVVVKVFVPQLLGAPKVMSDGSLQLTSTDANGGLLTPEDLANFDAQASTNLVDWVTLPDALTLTNGMVQLQDNARTNFPTRYYRVIEH